MCGTTHKTVKRIGDVGGQRRSSPRRRKYDGVPADKVDSSEGRISAKGLPPVARAAGYERSSDRT
jgi:hypothetical protein